MTDNKKDIIINTLFKCVEDLSEINIDQCMTNYISSKNQIDLLFQDLSFDRIKQIFNIFKPIFINLSENLTTNDIITMIIQNNYYEININNIMFILKIEEKILATYFLI